MHRVKAGILFLLVALFVGGFAARAEVGGKITGVVKDQSGAVIPGAAVVVTNTQTGAKLSATTDQEGAFTFPVVAVGEYQVDVTIDGFQPYRKKGLIIDINSALVLDVTLQLIEQSQSVLVTEGAAQVETTDTQLGQVLGSKKVTEIPLNGRSYTDLFATQVGVTPLTTSGAGNSTSGGGFGTVPVAGATNTGQIFDQRAARGRQRILPERSECPGRNRAAGGNNSKPRFHRGVSHPYEQHRRGVRELQRGVDQCGYQVRRQCVSRIGF
jgi:hypothetical protein